MTACQYYNICALLWIIITCQKLPHPALKYMAGSFATMDTLISFWFFFNPTPA